MISNPFKFGKEVSGEQFYDRQDAFEKLYRKLAGGSCNVVMYAPRRYGKTSLVNKVLARFEEEGVPTVSIDLNKIATVEKFCENYAYSFCKLAGRGREIVNRVSTYLSHLNPTFSFGGESVLSVRFNYGAKMSETSISSVLDLAEKIADEVIGGPIVVAFDEFQEIERLSLTRELRGCLPKTPIIMSKSFRHCRACSGFLSRRLRRSLCASLPRTTGCVIRSADLRRFTRRSRR